MDSQDKNLKKWIDGHEIPVDFDKLWENLEPHVPQKKKRRPLFWLFGLGLGIVAIVGIYYIQNAKTSDAELQYNDIQATSKSNKQIVAQDIHTPKGIENNSVSLVEENRKVSQKTHVAVNDSNIKNIKSALVESEKAQDIVPNEAIKYPRQTQYNEVSTGENKIFPDPTLHRVIKTDPQTLDDEKLKLSNSSINISRLEKILFPTTLVSLRKESNGSLSPSIIPKNRSTVFKPTVFGKLGAGLFTSSDLVHGKPLENINISLGASIDVSRRWSFGASLSANRYTTQLKHLQREYDRNDSNGIVEVIIDENGNQQSVTGAISSTQITKRDITWHTFHHVIEIPLVLRYKILEHKKHAINLFAGPSLTLYTFGNGAYINQENLLVKYSRETDPYQFQRWSLSSGMDWRWRCFKTSGLQLDINYNIRDLRLSAIDGNQITTFTSYFIQIGYFKNL